MKPTTDALMTLGHAWRQALADAHQARKERDTARAEVSQLRELCAEAAVYVPTAPKAARIIRSRLEAAGKGEEAPTRAGYPWYGPAHATLPAKQSAAEGGRSDQDDRDRAFGAAVREAGRKAVLLWLETDRDDESTMRGISAFLTAVASALEAER